MNKIYVISIGPGAYEHMTIKAIESLKMSEVIVGYGVYIDLVRPYFPQKEFLSTPMKQEALRCRMAFEEANKGKTVGFVCSGDVGVYGMAGLMYEIQRADGFFDTEIEIIPGVTAATAGAAILGAPLIHDFCVISLSDLLTPWEKIEKRLLMASQADFVVCLYNPSSKKRADYLKKACDILLTHKSPKTVCAYVAKIAREGEYEKILSLEELREESVDMFTTVFIGNSQTIQINGKMVTPRGYKDV